MEFVPWKEFINLRGWFYSHVHRQVVIPAAVSEHSEEITDAWM
jgi:hypothetical protein